MNLITCFIMGLGVGGMLPIGFALLCETAPKRHRGLKASSAVQRVVNVV